MNGSTTPLLTVGLPLWQAEPIVWLALEGLCRQEEAPPWELMVCEEAPEVEGQRAAGLDVIKAYLPRLHEAGCRSLMYSMSDVRMPPSHKWFLFRDQAHEGSQALLIQDADCFSQPRRLHETGVRIEQGFGWVQQAQGLFYDIPSGASYMYDVRTLPGRAGMVRTALNMGMRLDMLRKVEPVTRWRGLNHMLLDGILKANGPFPCWTSVDGAWDRGVDTHGYNTISSTRGAWMERLEPPFAATALTLADVVPPDIAERLRAMRTEEVPV